MTIVYGDNQKVLRNFKKILLKTMIEKSISETQKSQGIIPNGISGFLEIHSRKYWIELEKSYSEELLVTRKLVNEVLLWEVIEDFHKELT